MPMGYLFDNPLKELCRRSPSDVMSRYSTSAKNDGSTHVALGFLVRESAVAGHTTLSSVLSHKGQSM
jgi:hypothetical protein